MIESDGRSAMRPIRDALAAGDAPSLARAAHARRGIISSSCSLQTQASALAIEPMGRKGDLYAAPDAVKALGNRLEALLGELARFVQKRR